MKKGNIKYPNVDFPKCKNKSTTMYRPFSYFVDGGLDLTKTETDMRADVKFDSEEELGFGQTAVGCDPRVGFFDIAEQFGTEVANEATQEQPPMPTKKDEPTE